MLKGWVDKLKRWRLLRKLNKLRLVHVNADGACWVSHHEYLRLNCSTCGFANVWSHRYPCNECSNLGRGERNYHTTSVGYVRDRLKERFDYHDSKSIGG